MSEHFPQVTAQQNRENLRWLTHSLAFLDRHSPEDAPLCAGCENLNRDPDRIYVCILGHGECPKMPAHLRDSFILDHEGDSHA